ncbi:hypothetical protein BGZ65_002673 [Modicella reniformis]|uniref:Uncharacterized protein n=1 Tax=Modicella reniformis TaxID=1440133 RepID=A0A9P6INV5_9FUNG|nr:hypothetical protein BGZ65_002673 [Modicella reniformis]
MPPKRKASAPSKENPNKAARVERWKENKEAGKREVQRLTEKQSNILIDFMSERSNYQLLYDHKATKVKGNKHAFEKMAEYFVEKLEGSPDLIGNLKLGEVNATMMETKWKGLFTKYQKEKIVRNTTGHGIQDDQILPAADEKRCTFFKRMESVMAGHPVHVPIWARNIGLPGAISGFKSSSISPVASGSGIASGIGASAASALGATIGINNAASDFGPSEYNDMPQSPGSLCSTDELEDSRNSRIDIFDQYDELSIQGTEVPARTSPFLLPPNPPSAQTRSHIPRRRNVVQTEQSGVDRGDTLYTSVEKALNTYGTPQILYNHEVLKAKQEELAFKREKWKKNNEFQERKLAIDKEIREKEIQVREKEIQARVKERDMDIQANRELQKQYIEASQQSLKLVVKALTDVFHSRTPATMDSAFQHQQMISGQGARSNEISEQTPGPEVNEQTPESGASEQGTSLPGSTGKDH